MHDLNYSVLRIRMIEEAIAERYAKQEMRCPIHLSIGQEAVAVGVCKALGSAHDKIVSTHRCHAHYLAKGGSLDRMIAELHGSLKGCCGGRGGSMNLFDLEAGVLHSGPIVGSAVPLGVGVALSKKLNGEKGVVVVFMGDGATEEGVVFESMNFASIHSLPVMFVIENNLYSCFSHIKDRQPHADRPWRWEAMADLHDITNHTVCVARHAHNVWAEAELVIERIRRGDGPGIMACETYRYLEHCGPNDDDHLGYRDADEIDIWRDRDPVKEAWRNEPYMVEPIKAEIDKAFDFAKGGGA